MSRKSRTPNSPDVDTAHAVGPTSPQGVEASDLPDARGDVDTDPRKLKQRKLPQETGENQTGDVGMRATPGAADANDHGHRKRN